MKLKITSLIALAALTVGLTGCKDPEIIKSTGDERGLIALTASFQNDDSGDNSFPAEIDYENHIITVVFPYNYPLASDDVLPVEAMSHVNMRGILSTNSKIEPPLTTMDLTKDNYVTITNPVGVSHKYTIRGEIRKSNKCDINMFEIPEAGVGGVINQENSTVTLLTVENIGVHKAAYELSYHATLVPDVALEEFDFDAEGAKLTVVAQDGVTKKEYSLIKGHPQKLLSGMRPGSERILWINLIKGYGITKRNTTAGFAVTDKYIVMNNKGATSLPVLDIKTGNQVATMDISMLGANANHAMTSDEAGHILINTYYDNGGFKLWRFNDIDDANPELLISKGLYNTGNRVSVTGDVTKDAIIVAPINGTSIEFYRWVVKNGVIGDYEKVKMAGVASEDWGNADVAYTSATDPTADYYSVFYAMVNGTRGPVCYNGATNAVKYIGLLNTKKNDLDDAGNWTMNCCDFKKFNKGDFFFYLSCNTFSWGDNDQLYLMDVSGGNLTTHAVDFYSTGLDLNGKYGGQAGGTKGQAGNCNDARLWVSPDGYYMYAIFMFTNGYIGCVRVDCIDQ